jgi:hypothetical protein
MTFLITPKNKSDYHNMPSTCKTPDTIRAIVIRQRNTIKHDNPLRLKVPDMAKQYYGFRESLVKQCICTYVYKFI